MTLFEDSFPRIHFSLLVALKERENLVLVLPQVFAVNISVAKREIFNPIAQPSGDISAPQQLASWGKRLWNHGFSASAIVPF